MTLWIVADIRGDGTTIRLIGRMRAEPIEREEFAALAASGVVAKLGPQARAGAPVDAASAAVVDVSISPRNHWPDPVEPLAGTVVIETSQKASRSIDIDCRLPEAMLEFCGKGTLRPLED